MGTRARSREEAELVGAKPTWRVAPGGWGVCTCVCVYVHVRLCTCARLCACMSPCAHVCTRVCVCLSLCVHVCACVHMPRVSPCTRVGVSPRSVGELCELGVPAGGGGADTAQPWALPCAANFVVFAPSVSAVAPHAPVSSRPSVGLGSPPHGAPGSGTAPGLPHGPAQEVREVDGDARGARGCHRSAPGWFG